MKKGTPPQERERKAGIWFGFTPDRKYLVIRTPAGLTPKVIAYERPAAAALITDLLMHFRACWPDAPPPTLPDGPTCPPCNQQCDQGRLCPARAAGAFPPAT